MYVLAPLLPSPTPHHSTIHCCVRSVQLVAYIVGDLEYVETTTAEDHNGHKVVCRVYTLPGDRLKGEYAVGVAARTLDLYKNLFHIAYPLPKLDMVGIPDFETGAMENWGLVTYRMTSILFDPTSTPLRYKQNVASTVAHELAHQWFGNLVTMEWWSDLWLNEGFATWMATLVMDTFYPEWDEWTSFVEYDLSRALELDALRNSHPIEVDVKRPADANQIFDAISYSKGASLIRMLDAHLGRRVFLTGVSNYLKTHAYDNASTKVCEAADSQALVSDDSCDGCLLCCAGSVGRAVGCIWHGCGGLHDAVDQASGIPSRRRRGDQPVPPARLAGPLPG